MDSKKRQKIVDILGELYPEPKSELNFSNEFQLLISVILSAQCTDKKVNEVTPTLFRDFPNFEKLGDAPLKRVEEILRPVNYYRTKAQNIIKTGQEITKTFKGKLPKDHDILITLPGVGRKTANVVLGELGITSTLPVDTHVFRVSQRLGLAKGTKPREIEDQLMEQFEPTLWRPLHHWLILHGRRVCKAPNPNCAECALNKLCPYGRARLVES